jgi:carbon-monoxide dehydrogenase medium subunit
VLVNLREYHRPRSVAEAVWMIRGGRGQTAVLAGGTELVGRDDAELQVVVDLKGLGLKGMIEEDETIRVGAMTTLAELADREAAGTFAGGILARAIRQAAPATIRAAATIGGTLAGEKGGDEIPTALLALGATVILAEPEPREMPLGAFLANRAALMDRAVITHVVIPREDLRGGIAWVSRSPGDRAIVVAAATANSRGQRRVAVGGLAPYARAVDPGLQVWPIASDHRAGAEYRRQVAPVLIRRALEEAGAL